MGPRLTGWGGRLIWALPPTGEVNCHCDGGGTRLNYEAAGQAAAAVRCSAPLDEHWKDAMEEDFRKGQKKERP